MLLEVMVEFTYCFYFVVVKKEVYDRGSDAMFFIVRIDFGIFSY